MVANAAPVSAPATMIDAIVRVVLLRFIYQTLSSSNLFLKFFTGTVNNVGEIVDIPNYDIFIRKIIFTRKTIVLVWFNLSKRMILLASQISFTDHN
jgi:hypothetical protein